MSGCAQGSAPSHVARRSRVGALAAVLLSGATLAACGVADSVPQARPIATVTATNDAVAARAEVTFIAERDGDSRVRRPAEIILTCADGSEFLESLTWRGWGEDRATAQGRYVTNDCTPTCAQGKPLSYPAKVVADQLIEGEAAATYRRLTVTVDAPGSGQGGQQVYHLPGISPGDAAAGEDRTSTAG